MYYNKTRTAEVSTVADTSYYELIRDFKTDDLISHCGFTVYPSHFHNRPEITYVISGSCDFVINSQSGSASTDDIIYVSPYYPHSYHTSQDVDRYTMIPESGIDVDVLQLTERLTFPYVLDDKEFNRTYLLPLFTETYRIHSEKGQIEPTARRVLLKSHTNLIYGRFIERYGSRMEAHSKNINNLIQILKFIDDNSSERLTLDTVAEKFGYNRYYFSKFFNRHIGDSLTNYINSVRIRNFVKLYQLSPTSNLLDHAMSVGFESMPSFYRSFKRVYGCTPTQYFIRNNTK